MKKKYLVFIIILILCSLFIGFIYYMNLHNAKKIPKLELAEKSEHIYQNEINTEEQSIITEDTNENEECIVIETPDINNTEIKENDISTEKEKTEEKPKEETNIVKKNNEKQTNVKETKKAESKPKEKIENNKENVVESVKEVEEKIETPTTKNEEKVDPQKEETQPKQVEEKQEKKSGRFCVQGGSEHIEGDGEFDHGYYSTWDEAWEACKAYMHTTTTGGHYKVDQCLCGLYYFWVKPS